MIDYVMQHRQLFAVLNKEKIEYCVIQADVYKTTILIKEAFYDRIPKLMKSLKYKSLLHPYSTWYGYNFSFQMKEFQLYALQNSLVEVFYTLPCMSLTPKTWIPLDQIISNSVWCSRIAQDTVFYLDTENDFILRLTQSVFFKKTLDEQTEAFFSANMSKLNMESLHAKLQTVFFKFTEPLLLQLQCGAYDQIIDDYYCFSAY